MLRDSRKLKVRIDGKPREIEVGEHMPLRFSNLLRLIEYKYLFPSRSVKHVEKNGEVLHPSKLDEIVDPSEVNIVTEPAVNMVRKQIELATVAIDAMLGSIEQIVKDWYERNELARLYLNNLFDSLDWTVKVVEMGAKILPIYEGLDEAIAKLEDAVFRLDDLLFEGKESEAIEILKEEFPHAVREWRDFLKGMVRFIKDASGEVH